MEKHFKNKLKQHKVDWDKEDLLVGLEATLSKKESPSKWKWLFFLLPLLLMVTCWGVYKNDLTETTLGDLATAKNIDENTAQKEKENAITNMGLLPKNNTDNANELSGHSITQSTESVSKTTSDTKNHNQKKDFPEASNYAGKSSSTNINSDKENKVPTNLILNMDSINQLATVPRASTAIPETIIKNTETRSENLSTESLILKQTLVEQISKDKTKQAIITRLFVNSENFLFQELKTDITKNGIEVESKYKKKDSEPKKYTFYAEPSFVAGLPQRKTKYTNSDPTVNAQLEANKNMETPKIYSAISLEFGLAIKEKWMIQIGVEYQGVRELFKYDGFYRSDTTIAEYDKSSYFLDAAMDTVFFAGMRPYIENKDRKIRHWNTFQYYSIPLNIGRRFQFNKTAINTSVGISYAFGHDFFGRNNIIKYDGTNQIIDNTVFDIKSRFGFQVGIGGEYQLSERKQLFLKASLRRSPTFIQEGYEQVYWTYSLGFGMRYFLGDHY